jgi:hypothetical protein
VTFELHHVFVCASSGAPEAELLSAAGLVEGSPSTHAGQGTANRRFFFENGFLELLYVHDELEARSDLTAPTQLWHRWSGRGMTANPFGICLSSSRGMEAAMPFASWEYRPSYLPEGRCILFADGLRLSEPEVFFLNWPQAQASPGTEPTQHPLGLRHMLSVSVGSPDPACISDSLRAITDAGYVAIHQSDAPELVIEFLSDEEVQLGVPELRISLVGRPGSVA